MSILDIKHTITPAKENRVDVVLYNDDDFVLDNHYSVFSDPKGFFTYSENDIRIYLEDYLNITRWRRPDSIIDVEKRMRQVGVELFHILFIRDGEISDLWKKARCEIRNLNIRIYECIGNSPSLPWELLVEVMNDTFVSLHSRTFVRECNRAWTKKCENTPLKILYVVCRPFEKDVSPNSIFDEIKVKLKSNQITNRELRIDYFQPISFEHLKIKLCQSKLLGKPYNLVHFDGHGVDSSEIDRMTSKPVFSDGGQGYSGYILFCEPGNETKTALQRLRNFFCQGFKYLSYQVPLRGMSYEPKSDYVRLVHGAEFGDLLYSCGVQTLTLNACRSGYRMKSRNVTSNNTVSFVQEAMHKGLQSSLAMRYKMHEESARIFISDLYVFLSKGKSLAEAVTESRRNLYKMPFLRAKRKSVRIHAWFVPIIYESFP